MSERVGRTGQTISSGPGRLLTAAYGIFALSSSSRAGLQLATRFDEAPVAYLLSAFAAAVYVVATVALLRDLRRLALTTVLVELVGVVVVGTLSYADAQAFPDQTVWSGFGSGYGYLPLVLPVLGLLWLRSRGRDGGRTVGTRRGRMAR